MAGKIYTKVVGTVVLTGPNGRVTHEFEGVKIPEQHGKIGDYVGTLVGKALGADDASEVDVLKQELADRNTKVDDLILELDQAKKAVKRLTPKKRPARDE